MSVGSVTTISPGAARSARRSVSIYDRVEEARARRATALSRQPANISTKAPSAPGPAKPKIAAPASIEAPAVTPVDDPVPPTGQISTGSPTRWTIRGLTALLLILSGIAYLSANSAPPQPAPEFSPPVVNLTPQAFGPPLLATVSHRGDRAPTLADPAPLSKAAAGGLPMLDGSVPAPRAPAYMQRIDLPEAPAAQPASLITLPASIRPQERPQPDTLAQGSG